MKTYQIRDVTGDKYLNPASKFVSFPGFKALASVMSLVFTLGEQLKVLNAVVHSILVDMVNMLIFGQLSAYMPLHHMAMLIHEKVIIIHVAILHTLTSFVARLPLGVRSSLMLHGAASAAKKTLPVIVMNSLKPKFRQAKSTLHNIVKPPLFSRDLTYNNPFIHTIIILQGESL